MNAIFNILNEYVLSYVMRFIMGIFGNNFAVTILMFTVLINVLMIPLSIKSQKSTVQQIKIRPKLDALKRKYGDDRQKFAMAQQQLYKDENVSMSGGCLPMLLRLVFLMSIFYLVTQPFSYLTTVSNDIITSVKGAEQFASQRYPELYILDFVKNSELMNSVSDEALKANLVILRDATAHFNFDLFGISLTETPKFNLDIIHNFVPNWLVPIASGVAAFISGFVSSKLQKAMNPDAPSMMTMNLIMPLFSMYIAFQAPVSLGFYWACSSLVSGAIQAGVQYFYSPYKMIAVERAKNIIKLKETENKIINQ